MKDHHVDRPGVYVRQRTQLTGPNRPTGSINPPCTAVIHTRLTAQSGKTPPQHTHTRTCHTDRRGAQTAALGVGWTTWWLWRGDCTRSHPELGRENPQRRWYCVSRRGRVGRRQVFQPTPKHHNTPTNAGWSSPVARQAHNLKVIGSNPIPATRKSR